MYLFPDDDIPPPSQTFQRQPQIRSKARHDRKDTFISIFSCYLFFVAIWALFVGNARELGPWKTCAMLLGICCYFRWDVASWWVRWVVMGGVAAVLMYALAVSLGVVGGSWVGFFLRAVERAWGVLIEVMALAGPNVALVLVVVGVDYKMAESRGWGLFWGLVYALYRFAKEQYWVIRRYLLEKWMVFRRACKRGLRRWVRPGVEKMT